MNGDGTSISFGMNGPGLGGTGGPGGCGLTGVKSKSFLSKIPHSGNRLNACKFLGHLLPSSSKYTLNLFGIVSLLARQFFLERSDVFLQRNGVTPQQINRESSGRIECLVGFFCMSQPVKAPLFLVSCQSVVRIPRGTKVNDLAIFGFTLCRAFACAERGHILLFGIRTLHDA